MQEVELNIDEGRVDIPVVHPAGAKWKCPHCEHELSCYDHSPERTWRHLDTCQLETHLQEIARKLYYKGRKATNEFLSDFPVRFNKLLPQLNYTLLH